MKIKRRMVKHKANRRGHRGNVVYDWKSELFWGCAATPAEARRQNTAYMNRTRGNGYNSQRPDWRKVQLYERRHPFGVPELSEGVTNDRS